MEDVYHLFGYGIIMNNAIQLNIVVVYIQLMVHAESLLVAQKTGNEDASDDNSIKEDEGMAAKGNNIKKHVDESLIDTTRDDYEVILSRIKIAQFSCQN